MIGIALAFGTALSEAFKDIASKYNLKHIDEYVGAFALHFVQSILLAPVAFYFGVGSLSTRYFLVLVLAAIVQMIVILLYFKAIKRSEISTTLPLLTLTPLFMLVTSPIMIGEFPDVWGLLGIVLIVVGTYISNISTHQRHILEPFKLLARSQGAKYMIIVSFLWSITANLDMIGVQETSATFWAFSKDFLIMWMLLPIMLVKSIKPLAQLQSRSRGLMFVGIFKSASVLTQMFAIQYLLVAYVISIKRASAVFIILYAFVFLKEKRNFRNRMVGISIVMAGLATIALL